MSYSGLAQINALIRFYLGEDPKDIDHSAKLWGKLKFALEFDGKMKTVKIQEK